MSKTTKVLAIIIAILVAIMLAAGFIFFMRSSTQRQIKDIQSEYTGGLNRHLVVYSYDG